MTCTKVDMVGNVYESAFSPILFKASLPDLYIVLLTLIIGMLI